MKKSLCALFAVLCLAFVSCASEDGEIYFTKAFEGLMPGECCGTELRMTGKKVPFGKVELSSADSRIASVDAKGRITAVSEGKTVVTAVTETGKSASLCVRVYPEGFIGYVCPTGDKYPMFGYHTVMTERRDFEVMQECGLNLAMTTCSVEENLQVLKDIEGLDIKLVPYAVRNCTPEKAVELFSSHPNFGMYYINDEPSFDPEDTFAGFSRSLQKLDPSHMCYLNLLPLMADTTRYGGCGYENYLTSCLDNYNASFLCFDHYPIYVDKDTGETVVRPIYFDNVRAVSEVAAECAVPFWGYTMSIEHYKYPYPEEGHMRMQLFTLLAYGAQGFCYFEYSHALGEPDYKGALYDQEKHVKERSWAAAQAINAELQAYAPYLMGGQMLSVMGPEGFPGTNAYDASKLPWPVRSVEADNGKYIVSHLCNEGHEYMAVVNCDPFAPTTVRLAWNAGIKKISKDGKPVKALETETLPAGDILLYKLN